MNSVTPDSVDPSAPASLAIYALTSAIAGMILGIGPILVGAYVDMLGFTDRQAGYLLSAETAGFAAGGVLVFTLVRRMNWQKLVLLSAALLIGGNLIAASLSEFTPLLIIRFMVGIGANALLALSIVAIGLTRNPDRGYGMWVLAQIIGGAVAVKWLPGLIPDHGLAAVFSVFAGAGAVLACFYRFYPRGTEAKASHAPIAGSQRALILGLLALLGSFVCYAGQSAPWAFMKRFGNAAGLGSGEVNDAIFFSLMAGGVAAAGQMIIGNRFGRLFPLLAMAAMTAAGTLILASYPALNLYMLGACLINIGWLCTIPYMQAMIANLDSGSQLTAAVPIAIPASISAGPALAATFLVEGGGYAPIVWVGLVSMPIGLLLLYPAARIKD